MFSHDAIERALAAAQRPHPVVGVAIAVERDLDAAQTERQQAVHDLGGEQQAVGDDADAEIDAARRGRPVQPLGEVVHHRQVEQRFAAEEHQRDVFRGDAIHLALDPRRRPRGGLEGHLLGELVVVAVVALETVVAREIALERRQHRDVQLRRIARDAGEVAIEGPVVGLSVGDQEAVLVQQVERSPARRR